MARTKIKKEIVEDIDPIKNLSKPWQNFFDKFKEIETLKNSQWKDVHQLAYLTKRYEDLYKQKFAFTLQRAPGKCTEIVFIKKMCAMLNTTNARTIREYVDWVFDHKIIPNNLKIKTLAYFMLPGLGNEFRFFQMKKNTIERSTELSQEYMDIIASLDLPITTYGDLAFVQNVLEENKDFDVGDENNSPYNELFHRLLSIGFNVSVLKDLK